MIEGCIIIVLWGAASLLCGSLFVLYTKHCLLLQLSWCYDVFFAEIQLYKSTSCIKPR